MKRIGVPIAVLGVMFILLPSIGSAQSEKQGIAIFKGAKGLQGKARSKEDLEKALTEYERALEIFQKVNSKGQGVTLANIGFIYEELSHYQKALRNYEKALAFAKKIRDVKGEGATLSSIGRVCWYSSQYSKALEYYEKALAIQRKIRDLAGEGVTLGSVGAVYGDLDQHSKALEYYEKALEIHRKTGNVREQGIVLNNIGTVYESLGQYSKELEYYKKALESLKKTGNVASEGATLNNIGSVYKTLGQYSKVLEYYDKALQIDMKIGNVREQGTTLNNIGTVYESLGQHSKALEYYDKALETHRKTGNVLEQGHTLNNIGTCYVAMNKYDEALTNLQKALEIQGRIGVRTMLTKALIGNLYLDKGEFDKAEPFIKESHSSACLGRLYFLRNDYALAKKSYEALLISAEENKAADSLFAAYTWIAAACEGLKDAVGAAQYYQKAVKHTEELRSSLNPAERETFFDVRTNGLYRTAPYEGLARVQMRMNKPQEAFKTTEYTRARVFAEAMSRLSGGKNLAVPPEIVKEDNSINNELAALKKSLQKAYEKKNKLVIQSLEPQVKQEKGKLQAHIKMLRDKYPLFAATKYPQPMDLSQAALNDDEWVLAYHVTDPGIIIYLTKGKNLVKGLFKPTPRKEIDELVRKFRQPMEIKPNVPIRDQLTKFDFISGKKLSDILLSDSLSDLPKNTPVVIVPDGSLGVVPFEMLVLNDGGKIVTANQKIQASEAEFFGDRNPISYYQSITALTLARTLGKQKKPGEKLLAMVDPVFSSDDPRLVKLARQEKDRLLATLPKDLTMSIETEKGISFPRLPFTAQLGQSLKETDPETDLYEGMQAKKSVLLQRDLTTYRSLVFATHGYFGKDLPGIQEPVLVLSLVGEPKGKDGFLRLSEVMGLKINCDIAALTACQTGLGRHISGEGTMGMGRAFQYAGAKSVLMSLWSVAEKSSVQLVESFFKHLREGKNKLEALKLAKDEIRKAGYDHPFFWAPFILVGETD